jgi:hypothetical protein
MERAVEKMTKQSFVQLLSEPIVDEKHSHNIIRFSIGAIISQLVMFEKENAI